MTRRWYVDLDQKMPPVANVSQGFGVTAKSTVEARKMDPTATVTFRQGDVGEYLREEDTLFAT
jgi:hypothetical protein